jgi:hypothetical protein
MAFFAVAWDSLADKLIPVRLRKSIQLGWLMVQLRPMVAINSLFASQRGIDLYVLKHNGQICYLQAVLNDAFDNADRRIYIDGPDYLEPLHIYIDAEDKDEYLPTDGEVGDLPFLEPEWLYAELEIGIATVNFFNVHVPADLTYDHIRLAALINKFKLPSKSWVVITF